MSDGVLAERYAAAARSGGIVADAAQQAALDRLERLRGELLQAEKRSMVARLLRRFSAEPGHGQAARGVYLYGSVGRGKTWLMDLFSTVCRSRRSGAVTFTASCGMCTMGSDDTATRPIHWRPWPPTSRLKRASFVSTNYS